MVDCRLDLVDLSPCLLVLVVLSEAVLSDPDLSISVFTG